MKVFQIRFPILLILSFSLLGSSILVPNSSAQDAQIPNWIKNTAGWWSEDLIEDIHHIDDLIPLLKQIYKVQKSHKISLKDDIQVIVEPDDAKALYEMYKKLNEKNKKEFSKKLFESKKDFWNMVSFSRSRGE